MNIRRGVAKTLSLSLGLAGAAAVLVIGGSPVAASTSSNTTTSTSSQSTTNTNTNTAGPQTSSKKHKHEKVTCHPGHVDRDGQCQAKFRDPLKPGHHGGQTVCFSVTPSNAGTISTGSGSCTTTNGGGNAFATFQASGSYCGTATINATEPGEGGQTHHTVIHISCTHKTVATGVFAPAGAPLGGAGAPLLVGLSGGVMSLFGRRVWRRVASR